MTLGLRLADESRLHLFPATKFLSAFGAFNDKIEVRDIDRRFDRHGRAGRALKHERADWLHVPSPQLLCWRSKSMNLTWRNKFMARSCEDPHTDDALFIFRAL